MSKTVPIWVASGVLAIVLIWLGWGMRVPIVPDEVGYLAIGKLAASGEAMNLSLVATYNFGQGVILAPLFWLLSSPAAVYQSGIVLSCIFTACVPLVLTGIARRMEIAVTWPVVMVSFLAAIMPAYFYNAFLIWSEAAFRLCFLLALYVLASAWVLKRDWIWVAFAIAIAALYAIHPRALLILPLAFVWLLFGALLFKKCSRIGCFIAIAVLVACVVGISAVNGYFQMAIWHHRESSADKFGNLFAMLFAPAGMKRAAAVGIGQVWALCASSFGIFVVGAYAAWQMCLRDTAKRPVLWFAAMALIGIWLASIGQMIAFSRIDHAIYERYVDGGSTLFVWLGLLFLIGEGKAKGAVVWLLAAIVMTAIPILHVFAQLQLGPPVTPNISGLLWVNRFIPIQNAPFALIVAMGSLMAVAATASSLSLRPWGIVLVAIVALSSDFIIHKQAVAAHIGRQLYVDAASKLYVQLGPTTVHWDASVGGNGNLMIDQFASIGRPLPPSDIAQSPIENGAGAVVGKDFAVPEGYACVGRLPDKAKLIIKGPPQPGWKCP